MAKLSRRWMIKGTLTTASPLHIGSGYHDFDDRLKKRVSDAKVKVAKVASNFEKRPYIPGSTLKGNLRSWARACKLEKDPAMISLFGSLSADDKESRGGKADFFDCHAVEVNGIQHHPPYWSEAPEWCNNQTITRWTGIMTSTQINRRTRTVADGKLFHTEYVPAGVSFQVRIGGQDTDGEEGYDEIKKLLALFEGFHSNDVSLGAETGNDWGRFDWKLDDVLVFDSTVAAKWAANTTPTVGYAALESVGTNELQQIRQGVSDLVKSHTSNKLVIGLTLEFEGSFLVDDPYRAKQGDDKEKFSKDDSNRPADHEPLIDSDGRLWLPSRSFRGAFRSQAERILRTIGGDSAACYPDGNGPRRTCKAISDVSDVVKLCPACQMFGATGWRSPIEVTAFKTKEKVGEPQRQDFVAIDRFTGGAADGAKFDARSYYQPKLSGRVSLDPEMLERTANPKAFLGLLFLTLRDLVEGDIRFGFGSSKGYGACSAKIDPITGFHGNSTSNGFWEQIDTFFSDPTDRAELHKIANAIDKLHEFVAACKAEQENKETE